MTPLKAKGKNKKANATGEKTINASHCPKNLSLEEWQRALRRQAAAKESIGITSPSVEDAPFVASSAISGRTYRVRYYGANSPLNRCECMDFKTSRLGTCKHIEAITKTRNGLYAHKAYKTPCHTSVYVDYPAGRKIRILLGRCAGEEMRRLAGTLFDSDGTLTDVNRDPSEFIRAARSIDDGFEWETDAMDLLIEMRDARKRRRIVAEKYRDTYFDGLLKTSLHPYQADGVRFAFAGGRTINADEMGLGKTVQAIAAAELLRREKLVESVIIICPTSLKYQWLSEIRRFTDSEAIVVEGNLTKRKELLTASGPFYKICSFHAMSNTIKSGFVPEADMVVYDELQRLKNKDTQMGRQLRRLHSRYVLALSGTPLENKLDELYSVTQLVDQYVLGPYYRFTSETTLTDEIGKVVGYKNLHAIAERLRHTLIRRRKADVRIQMPARTDTNLFVPLTKEQRAIHDEYKFNVGILIQKWKRQRFLSEADRKRLLLFLSMMRMVCDSTFILDQKTRHDTKIDELKAIISNLLSNDEGKVVIFSQWERMLRILAAELEQEGIDFCFLHGGVPSPKRRDLIERFRDDAGCRIFLSTDAGATGLNLQTASLLINIDLPWNPAVLEQRIARIYRLGQNNPVQIINMIAADTIEENMLSTLKFKSNLAAGILDGGDDAVFVENSKFDRIVETIDSVVSDSAAPDAEEPKQDAQPAVHEEAPERPADETEPETASAQETAADASAGGVEPAMPRRADGSGAENRVPSKPGCPAGRAEAREAVAAGVSALGRIAEMLRDPESTRALADALVKEDPETGQASLNIPVPDKSTVVNILSAFATLLNR